MSKDVQKLFTSIASSYDFLNHFLSFSIDRRWRHRAVQALKMTEPVRVLDLCAGTLDLSQNISTEFPSSQVFAVDFSLAMLEVGRKKLNGSKQHIHLIGADGHHLPFAAQSFDSVTCAFGIRNLEVREKAATEIYRVLKPGGALIVLEFFRPEKFIPRFFYQTYGKYILPRLGGAISKNREAYEYLHNSIQHFMTVEEYKSFLEMHGFEKIETMALSGGIAHRVIALRGKSP